MWGEGGGGLLSPSIEDAVLRGCLLFIQEAEEVANQVQGLKQQLGIDNVDRLVEDYPR